MRKKIKNERILNVAQKIFATFGLKKTTVDEIAQKAGIGKGTIYNYFKSKEELFAKVVEREVKELKEKITEAVQKVDPPEKKLEAFLITKIKHLFKLKNFYSIKRDMLDAIFSELKKIIKDYYEFEKRTLNQIIKSGIRQKIFKINNLSLIVNTLSLTLRSLELYWLRDAGYNSPEKPIKDVKHLLKIFFNGIKYSKKQV